MMHFRQRATCVSLVLFTLPPDFSVGSSAGHRSRVLSLMPGLPLLENVWDFLNHKVGLLKAVVIKR